MEFIGSDENHNRYWETNMFLQKEEFDSFSWDDTLSGYYDSSSPDGAPSSIAAAKNIISERNRRKKLNERLFALRSVVPNISKMDKASIIKDAIAYIQDLHEQEKLIRAEIAELEEERLRNPVMKIDLEDDDDDIMLSRPKKKRTSPSPSFGEITGSSTIDIVELRVSYVGEKTLFISLTCDKKTDTMVRLCEAFESLKLKIITANITSLAGKLLKTLFIEASEEERDQLKVKIESAIATQSDPESPMSF